MAVICDWHDGEQAPVREAKMVLATGRPERPYKPMCASCIRLYRSIVRTWRKTIKGPGSGFEGEALRLAKEGLAVHAGTREISLSNPGFREWAAAAAVMRS